MDGIADLPFPKRQGQAHSISYTLPRDLFLTQWIVPAGAVVRLTTTSNFGHVVLPEGTLDKRGSAIPRRIFSY